MKEVTDPTDPGEPSGLRERVGAASESQRTSERRQDDDPSDRNQPGNGHSYDRDELRDGDRTIEDDHSALHFGKVRLPANPGGGAIPNVEKFRPSSLRLAYLDPVDAAIDSTVDHETPSVPIGSDAALSAAAAVPRSRKLVAITVGVLLVVLGGAVVFVMTWPRSSSQTRETPSVPAPTTNPPGVSTDSMAAGPVPRPLIGSGAIPVSDQVATSSAPTAQRSAADRAASQPPSASPRSAENEPRTVTSPQRAKAPTPKAASSATRGRSDVTPDLVW